MRIYVTGITGFVGGAVANYFGAQGHEVTGMGRRASLPKHICPSCKYVQADITKPLTPITADVVIHAAGLASDTASFKETYDANVRGTQHVFDASKGVKQVVHISSSSVYDFTQRPMSEEEAGLNYKALSDYGKSKLLAEHCIQHGRYDNNITVLRPRAIYGPHDLSLLPRLVKLIKGDKLVLPANLSTSISLTHIDNLVRAIQLSIDKQTNLLEVYNVADEVVYDLRDTLTKLLPLVVGRPLRTATIPKWIFNSFIAVNNHIKLNRTFNRFAAASLTHTAVLNIDKIKSELNYRPLRNFENSYREIGDWVAREGGLPLS